MIFISYRKEDSAHLSLSLAEKLRAEFGEHAVFLDRQEIKPGQDWHERIDSALSKSSVVLAVIGKGWLTARDDWGQRRIDQEDDVLAYELSSALRTGMVIIPLYLDGIEPLPEKAFPRRLAALASQQGIPFDIIRDMPTVIERIKQVGGSRMGERSESYRDLIKPLTNPDQTKLLERFTGREWVEKSLDSWVADQRHSRVFCLLGGPGIGKSAIACNWCHTRQDVIAFHYCVYGHAEKTDPKRILLSLIAQIAVAIPEYEERLSEIEIGELKEIIKADTRAIFDNLLLKPLSGNFPRPERDQLVVIDALDEATHGEDNELASFIGQVWTALPDWLRLVTTSRPEMDVIGYLGSLHPFILNASSRENLQDIRKFLRKELAPEQASDQVLNQIVEKSEGMFLYAYLVLDEIRARRLTLDEIAEFPEGLTAYYKGWFGRKFPDVNSYHQELHKLVSTIISQRAPLPLSVLERTLGFTSYEVDMRLRRLGVLFPLRKETEGNRDVTVVTLMHKSLRDWLTDKNPLNLHPLAGAFAADPELGNRLLAEEAWKVFSNGELGESSYFQQTIFSHLADARQTDRVSQVLLDPALVESLWSNELRDIWQRQINSLSHTVSLTKLVQDWIKSRDAGASTPRDAVAAGKLCRLFEEMGAYDEAVLLGEAALKIWQENNVADSSDMVGCLLALGHIRSVRDELVSATETHEKALAIAQRAYAADSPEMADVLYALCVFYTQGKRDYKKASDCLEECLAIRSKSIPPDYIGMANCINDRSVILEAEGMSGDYVANYQEALSLFEKAGIDSHAEMVSTLGNIGYELLKEEKHIEAVKVLRRAEAMAERVLLPQHEYSGSVRARLASALLQSGEYDQALEVIRAYVAQLERYPGPDHDQTADARVQLCRVLLNTIHLSNSAQQGYREELRSQCQRIRRAEPGTVLGLLTLSETARRIMEPAIRELLMESSRRICRAYADRTDKNPSKIVAARCFADVFETLHSGSQITQILPLICSIWEKTVPQLEHEADCLPRTRKLVVALIAWAGRVRLDQEDDIEAIRNAYELIDTIGSQSPETLDHLAGLTVSLHRRHHEDICEELCHRLLVKSDRILGADHIQTLQYMENLAHLQMHRGKLEEAEQFYRRALETRLAAGCERSNTLSTVGSLAECLLLRGSFDEARDLIREYVAKLPVSDAFSSARKGLARILSSHGVDLKNEFENVDAGKVSYELSLEIDPNSSRTHGNLALLLWVCFNDTEGASEHFKKALDLDSSDGNIHSNYAHFLAQTINDPEKALKHFNEGERLSPNDSAIPGNHAALLIKVGDLPKAWSLSTRAMRLCIPAPDRIMARPLFCAANILLLKGQDPAVPLGQLKSLFDHGIDHVPWVITATLETLLPQLGDAGALIQPISDAINDKRKLATLEAIPAWKAIPRVSFETPWPQI